MNGMCGKSGDHLPNVIRTPAHSTLEEHTNVIATPPALQTFPTGGRGAGGQGDHNRPRQEDCDDDDHRHPCQLRILFKREKKERTPDYLLRRLDAGHFGMDLFSRGKILDLGVSSRSHFLIARY